MRSITVIAGIKKSEGSKQDLLNTVKDFMSVELIMPVDDVRILTELEFRNINKDLINDKCISMTEIEVLCKITDAFKQFALAKINLTENAHQCLKVVLRNMVVDLDADLAILFVYETNIVETKMYGCPFIGYKKYLQYKERRNYAKRDNFNSWC